MLAFALYQLADHERADGDEDQDAEKIDRALEGARVE
jgi:hypothetical protein